ncbi:ligninase H2 [Coniochaeta sp. 2T2.1]|nr:ligninase H2 [Coniochaeta sp. 2T2.1]
MHLQRSVRACVLLSFLGSASAWPGMNKTLNDLMSRETLDTGVDDGDSHELIGDLVTLTDSQLTPVGRSIKNIITGLETGQSAETWRGAVPAKGSAACKADTCCIWTYISADMWTKFLGKAGRCNNLARASIRLGFHDAAGWSKGTGGGGADGSLILSGSELTKPENNGLQEVSAYITKLYGLYKSYDVTYADLIQMAATVATVTCPLGPRIRSYVGRRDNATPAPPGLLPDVNSDADTLIKLFQDKTISAHGLTALLGAHSTSQQRFVDPSRAGDPQDSSPGVWDVKYYKQTLGPAPPRVFKFQSDINLAQDPRIAPEFQSFASDQGHWNEDYAKEYVRLSLLGVNNINDLKECSKVLPLARRAFVEVDRELIDKWLNSTEVNKAVADAVLNGDLLTGLRAIIEALKKKIKGGRLARGFSAS